MGGIAFGFVRHDVSCSMDYMGAVRVANEDTHVVHVTPKPGLDGSGRGQLHWFQ